MFLRHGAVLCAVISLSAFAEPVGHVVSVSVPGTGLDVNLATQVGHEYDASTVAKDVRYLYSLGRFDDVRAEAQERPDGIAVVFHTKLAPRYLLREIRIEPNTYGIEVHVPPLTPIGLLDAHTLARDAERQLRAEGYANARVTYSLRPRGNGDADLKMKVDPGNSLRVKQVSFEGDDRMRSSVKALRIHRILFWRLLPSYSDQAITDDAARVRAAYVGKGYFDARVTDHVEWIGKDARVTFAVQPGTLYPIQPQLCTSILSERRESERLGVLDFTAKLDAEGEPQFTRGPSYRVGRIEFTGNHRFSDSAVRGNFLFDEGAIFDEQLLRRSVARLNRTNWFQRIEPRDVIVHPNADTGLADVTVKLNERKDRSWKLSGPVGPLSFAGPVQASIASRLPWWSSYTLSASLFVFGKPLLPILNAPKGFIPVVAFSRPFVPGEGWKSGFAIAPALGWQNTLVGYGATQLQQRLQPLVSGERTAEPELQVSVVRPQGEAQFVCEQPRTTGVLGVLRGGAMLGLHVLGAAAAF